MKKLENKKREFTKDNLIAIIILLLLLIIGGSAIFFSILFRKDDKIDKLSKHLEYTQGELMHKYKKISDDKKEINFLNDSIDYLNTAKVDLSVGKRVNWKGQTGIPVFGNIVYGDVKARDVVFINDLKLEAEEIFAEGENPPSVIANLIDEKGNVIASVEVEITSCPEDDCNKRICLDEMNCDSVGCLDNLLNDSIVIQSYELFNNNIVLGEVSVYPKYSEERRIVNLYLPNFSKETKNDLLWMAIHGVLSYASYETANHFEQKAKKYVFKGFHDIEAWKELGNEHGFTPDIATLEAENKVMQKIKDEKLHYESLADGFRWSARVNAVGSAYHLGRMAYRFYVGPTGAGFFVAF